MAAGELRERGGRAKETGLAIEVAFSERDPKGYLNGLSVEFEIDGVLNGRRTMTGERSREVGWAFPSLCACVSALSAAPRARVLSFPLVRGYHHRGRSYQRARLVDQKSWAFLFVFSAREGNG